jgi:hypothetical protein
MIDYFEIFLGYIRNITFVIQIYVALHYYVEICFKNVPKIM